MIIKLLSEIKGFKLNNPDGAFYVFPDISYYFGKKITGKIINSASDFAMVILEKAHVATVTGDAVGFLVLDGTDGTSANARAFRNPETRIIRTVFHPEIASKFPVVEKMETGQRVLSRTNRNRSWFGKFFGSCGPD